ncbi:TPA: hypothetical protein ACN38N_004431 [Vibrio parahaemolyticus]
MVIEELESSDVIALCALLVAALSLAFTIWQGVQTRKHNVLMAKPVISFEVDITDTQLISFKAINHGTGVAEVRSIEFLASREWLPLKALLDFETMLRNAGLHDAKYSCYLHEQSFYLSPGKEISILELKAPHVTSVEFAKSLPDFKVNYRCPYLTEYVYFWSPLKP